MKHSLKILSAVTLLAFPANAADEKLPAGVYTLDKSHASLTFSVSHLGFSNYTAGFDSFSATLNLDPAKPENATIEATIDPTSLDLPSPPEGFLKTITTDKNWLNANAFPQITFKSTSIKMIDEKNADITGDLTLLGVKKSVTLQAKFNGGYTGHPMDAHARVGFTAVGSFKRSDFGMNYGIPLPGTTMGVSDEVNLVVDAEFSGPALMAPTENKGKK